MAPKNPNRSAYFPAIEKKHGEPIRYWLKAVKDLGETTYPKQIAFLRENYGFSQAHANAVVMYVRGSKSSKRFASPEDYFKKLDPVQAKTARKIFKIIRTKYPKLELVVAWNQPMLMKGKAYVFGLSATKNYLLIAPYGSAALKKFAPQLKDYKVNKKTIQIPSDWKVDSKILLGLVKTRLSEVD